LIVIYELLVVLSAACYIVNKGVSIENKHKQKITIRIE